MIFLIVKSCGTEGRKNGIDEIEPDGKIYEFIAFSSNGIKDLYVSESPV